MVNLYFQFMQAGGLLSQKTLSLTKIKEKDQRVPKQQNKLHLRLVLQDNMSIHMDQHMIWASLRLNLSSGFPTMRDSNQCLKLQRLARILKFHL